jgi:hypothetical protein
MLSGNYTAKGDILYLQLMPLSMTNLLLEYFVKSASGWLEYENTLVLSLLSLQQKL